jgi:AsmA protein
MKWLRRLLLAMVVVGAVIAAAAVLLPRLIDPSTLRTMLVLAARHHTGRELTVGGDIRFTLLPRPAVVLPRLSLADIEGFGPEPFASIDSARINLRLWPLLRGRLAVASAEIDHPQLRLTVDAQGRRNWGDLLPSTDPAATPSADSPADRGSMLKHIGIARLAVRDADILWTDRRSGQWARLYRLDASLEDIDFARPSPLLINGTLDMGDPLRSAEFKLATTVQAADDGHWRAPDLRLDAVVTGTPLQGPVPLRLSADADFDAVHGRLRLRPLTLSNDQFDITGELTAVRGVGNTPAIGAELHIDRLDARTLAQRLGHPPATRDRTVLSHVSGTVELGASASEVNVARLDLQVDDSHWQGNARFSALASPAVRIAIDADKLDLDRYLPPQKAVTGSAGGNLTESAPPASSPAAAFSRLGQLDLQGTVNVTALTLGGVVAERVALAVRAHSGRIAMSPITAGLYGGSAEADVQIDARSADPRLQLEFGLSDVAAGPLLGALSRHETVDGRLNLSGDLSGSVAAGEALLRSLNGRLRAAMGQGALKGINPDRSLCRARARDGRDDDDGCDPSPDARFSMLRLGGYVAHGVWRSGDVLLVQQRRQSGSVYRLFGGGTLDLATGEIDYRLRAREAAGALHVHGRNGEYSTDLDGRSAPRASMRRSRQRGVRLR